MTEPRALAGPFDPAALPPDGPDALGRELAAGPEAVAASLAAAAALPGWVFERLETAPRVVILGTGASLAAARTAAPLWPAKAGRTVLTAESAAAAFEVTDGYRPMPADLVLSISKSGTSPETLAAARLAREGGGTVVAVTASPDSPLARQADAALMTPIGIETDASTKSELAATAALLGLAGLVSSREALSIDAGLRADVASWAWAAEYGSRVARARFVWFLGFGSALGVAAAGALLWHEKVRRPALATTPSDFRHGFIEAATAGDAVVLVDLGPAPPDRTAYLDGLTRELREVGTDLIRLEGPGASAAERALRGMLRVQQLARSAAHAAGTYVDGFVILRSIVRLEEPARTARARPSRPS